MTQPKITLTATQDAVEGGANGIFTITLDSPAPAGGFLINYDTTGSTAAHSDYQFLPNDYSLVAGDNISVLNTDSLRIKAGASSATLKVIAVTDTMASSENTSHEPTESVKLTLSTGYFAPSKTFTAAEPVAIKLDDVNADGYLDVITVGNNRVSLLRGDGHGGFANLRVFAVGNHPVSVDLADVNTDGHIDLLTTNAYSYNVSVLLGNGKGGFTTGQSPETNKYLQSISLGDVNNDGYPDIVAVYYDTVSLLLGNGQGGFTAGQNFTIDTRSSSVGLSDFNNDGYLDMVIANGVGSVSGLRLLVGDGKGGFSKQQLFAVGGSPSLVGLADVNEDGYMDVLTSNHFFYNNNVSLLLGDGKGGFAKQQIINVGYAPDVISLGDINGDGHVDLVATGGGNYVSLLLGDGQGNFSSPEKFAVGGYPTSVALADVNGDGRVDMLNANQNDRNVSVLLNTGEKFQSVTKTVNIENVFDESLDLYGDTGTSNNDLLMGKTNSDKLHGLTGNDTLSGSAGNDFLGGGKGNDRLLGGDDNDVLYGAAGRDVLLGDASNDRLIGGNGNDRLTGGVGYDRFIFNYQPTASNIDTITDFSPKDDKIELNAAIFNSLERGYWRALKTDTFIVGTAAVDINDRIIYEKTTGAVFYDDDGTGEHAAVQIATLGVNLQLTAADFLVI